MPKEIYETSTSLSNDIQLSIPSSIDQSKRASKIFLFSKRCIDILLAILGLIVTSPLFILIALLYLFGESKGQVFFKQQRYGKNGEKSNIYKFRSMVVNADEKLKSNKL